MMRVNFLILIFLMFPFFVNAKEKIDLSKLFNDSECQKTLCFNDIKCKTTKSDFNQIRDNCIISKLEPNANSTLRHAVRNSCSRIACNPSFIEKLRFK